MVLSLDNLPEEILHTILCYCRPCSAAALQQTAHRFEHSTNEPLLWRFYCQAYFKYWDSKHDILQKLSAPVCAVDWKALYVSRHLTECTASHLLDSILAGQTGRIEKFRALIDLGYDVKDTLIRNISSELETDDHLARRYYGKVLLTCLHRSIALPVWARLRNGGNVALERALGAFDLFIPESGYGSLAEITNKLDEIVGRLSSLYPSINMFTPRDKARTIAVYLKSNNLTGIQPDREYHCLEHNFLGVALNDPNHNSLPLVSAAIYCYVAQRFGLNARPCGFPFHVHVIVKPPLGLDVDGNVLGPGVYGDPIYMDPFRSDRETPVTNLQRQLNYLGASSVEQSTFLDESRTSEIVLRCSKNILNSVQRMSQYPDVHLEPVDTVSAKYAALWSTMLLSDPSRPAEFRHHLPWLMELFATEFPSDIYLVEQYVVPIFRGLLEYEHILESLHVMRAVDEIPKQVKRRYPGRCDVKYRIGQVFRHRRYSYIAIITGWDTECDAGEQWMRRMGIDRLQGGRHQSFYHVLVQDRSVRYVAEENIELLVSNISDLPTTLTAIAGKHFKRWDEETQSFVSNIKDEYPDD
ncbi:Hemimethylated DNA-binding protein YccV like-domain-containing protein [Aspergillus pseudotamarii]|uniref:Hemimethylated DNA-binding protein YccV like-domain-containing protein n=1 Tax=Aspergillus pseudotamarii TaxID=132259 RepID=A0A5N6SBT6_ASPPS|nr:Hemimethylated DNA-binding protein YccV like-domain-containing protein [Aspergillus pseudotamarii]KAE8131150.1 Hemimethylated DNA-binding protein YccV like-domain-containing protein [Aspergillus pseudotamarii]